MKRTIGVVLMFVGLILGVYVGIVVGFIGGVMQVVHTVRAEELANSGIAWGVARILFATPMGVLTAAIPISIGKSLVGPDAGREG